MSTKGKASSADSNGFGLAHSGSRRGRDGTESDCLADIQRARLLTAMVDACAQHGPGQVTVADVVERAGVSRRTFYEIFDDCQDCLCVTLEDGLRRMSKHVLPAYRRGGRWPQGLRASLLALLEFLDNERVIGRLVIVGSLGSDPRMLELRRHVLRQIVAAVDEGRTVSKGGNQLSALTAEGIVGGVLAVLHTRLVDEHPGRLLELAGPLMSTIVLPYLGATAAHQELERPEPTPQHTNAHTVDDPLRNLGLRLTYRTVRALLSVADNPGSSNRQIGEAAGIADQGQMSKLLSRLERSGLVRNSGLGPGTGEPNIWTLTERGAAIRQMIAPQSSISC